MAKGIVTEIIDLLELQRSFIKNVESLNDDQLNWIPKGSKNSIGILIEHMTGAERSLVQQMIFGLDITRDRDKEFENRKRSVRELVKSYTETAQITKNLLSSKLTDDKLLEVRTRNGVKKTIFWALGHLLEHNNYHIGQVNLMLAMIKET